MNLNQKNGAYHLIKMYKQLDFHIPFNITLENKTYTSLHDYFTQNNHMVYMFVQFSMATTQQEKELIFNQIIEKSMKSYDNTYHEDLISTPLFTQFYDFARKQTSNDTEFFTKWFLLFSTGYSSASQDIKNQFYTNFNQEKYQLAFDLPHDNPHFILLNAQTTREDNKIVFKTSFESQFFIKISRFFNYQGAHLTNNDNVRLIDFLKKDMQYSNSSELIHDLTRNIPKNKNGFFGIFTDKKIPLQFQNSNHACKIIDDQKDVITSPVKNNPIVESNIEESSSFALSKFNDILNQAKEDSVALQQLFNHYQHRNLNLEVKIRSENLVLYQINFLKSIENAIDTIDIQDIFFLKNNLGKYLIQCIDTYGKSIARHEVLVDSRNSKLFSKNIDVDNDIRKENIDKEALKQLALLEKELDLVKEHILNQFDHDLLREMKVRTRFLESKIEQNPLIQEESKLRPLK